MKLPEDKSVYIGGMKYRNECPDSVFDSLKQSTQDKIKGVKKTDKPDEKKK